MATIVILQHEVQRRFKVPYLVMAFAERWRSRGHEVLVHFGVSTPPPAELAILHIDQTVVPEAYRALLARYPRVLNGRVLDASKSVYSRQAIKRETDWPGHVIVKTEANIGGRPERAARIHAQKEQASWIAPETPHLAEYPIYASVRTVPEKAWTTPGLLVEKFVPEKDEHGYYLRVWTFFGDRESCSRCRSPEPIVKSENVVQRVDVPVPDEMRAWRSRLGYDFGKFDFVRHGNEWLLLDANKTPSAPSGTMLTDDVRERLGAIADGMASFIG
jgi:hypothetical protein